MEQTASIVVVDDDLRLRDLLDQYLAAQGFAVRTLEHAGPLTGLLESEPADLIILDLMLPGEVGLSVCRRLRATGNDIPIIMLTAKGDDVDRIVGLESGADDYLPKPFNPRELVARINAVLRRRQPPAPPGAPVPHSEPITFGRFRFDLTSRLLTTVDGDHVPLTTGEFSLLKVLVSHAHEPLSREQLLELARGREYEALDRSIDVQISRLRRLIEEHPGRPRHIQTVWGHGYVFVPDGSGA